MSKTGMPASIRLTKTEQQQLHRKCIELNKQLMAKDKLPIRESELVHTILEHAIKKLHVTKSGYIELE